MTRTPRYRFTQDEHWRDGLMAALGGARLLDPAKAIPLGDIRCVRTVVAANGEMWFVNRDGVLSGDGACGPELGWVRRIAVGPERIWVLGGGRLSQFDRHSLQLLRREPAADLRDIAADGRDGVWLLRGRRTLARLDTDMRSVGNPVALEREARALGVVAGTRFLLARDGGSVTLIDTATSRLVFADALRELQPDWGAFTATRLTPGPGKTVAASGCWSDRSPGFVLIDVRGSITLRAKWPGLRRPPEIAFDGDALVAVQGGRPLRFAAAALAGGEVRLTPALDLEGLAGTWLHGEVAARLPERGTLSVRWAATEDAALRRSIEAIAQDQQQTSAARLMTIGRLLGPWSPSYGYVGEAHDGPTPQERFAFPLHEAPRGSTLWVEIRVETHGAAEVPRIEAVTVLHDADGLVGNLPAHYRGSGDADGTLRRLVGVLEATTSGIDDTIDSLAARLDPHRTDPHWLPVLAGMLGLPFDAALDLRMQRNLLAAAPAVLEHRGTRQGIVALLAALFPGRPVRIEDRGATLLPVALGSATLPGLLLGPSARLPRLNARLVLGRTALQCRPKCEDGLVSPSAQVVVTVPATPSERTRLGAALQQMLEAMLPAGLRLVLRWAASSGQGAPADDGIATLVDSPAPLRIGVGSALGAATLGGRRGARLGPDGTAPIGQRLL